jgi:hypothetical protein
MSTTHPPRSQGIRNNPARQQLDELDALLQRMLDLPVNTVAEELLEETRPEAEQVTAELPTPPALPAKPKSLKSPRRSESDKKPKPSLLAQVPPPEVGPGPPAPEAVDEDPVAAQDAAPQVGPASRAGPEASHAGTDMPDPAAPGAARLAAPAPDAASEKDEWVPLRSSWKPSPHTWQPLAKTWQQAQLAAERDRDGEQEADPAGQEEIPHSESGPPVGLEQTVAVDVAPVPLGPAVVQEPVAEAGGEITSAPIHGAPSIRVWSPEGPDAEDSQPSVSTVMTPSADEPTPGVWVQWLVSFNRRFDTLLGRTGAMGQWLCGPSGRTLLGVLGLGFLAAALGLAAIEWFGWTR